MPPMGTVAEYHGDCVIAQSQIFGVKSSGVSSEF
jgi:hypothetical protein